MLDNQPNLGPAPLQKEFNGRMYTTELLPTSVGIQTLTKITETLGDSLGVIADSLIRNDMDIRTLAEQDFFTSIAVSLTSNLGKLEVVKMVRALLDNVYCEGRKIDYENHFKGNYGELLLILSWIFAENFGSVFTQLLKARGLEISTLRSMMDGVLGQKQSESND